MYIYALIYIVNAHKYDFIANLLYTNCASLNTNIHYPSVSNSIRYKYVLCIRDRFYHFNFCMYVSRLRREAGSIKDPRWSSLMASPHSSSLFLRCCSPKLAPKYEMIKVIRCVLAVSVAAASAAIDCPYRPQHLVRCPCGCHL